MNKFDSVYYNEEKCEITKVLENGYYELTDGVEDYTVHESDLVLRDDVINQLLKGMVK